MLSFLKRIQRWHEEHKPIENPEKQGNQKVQAPLAALHHEERELIEVEKRNNQQAQALLAALHKLQCNMDPFIAAQTYNSRFCPLTSRLPDELLLCVLDFLSDDVVTLSCLRIVSRKFFHMVGSKPVYGENLKPIIYQSESLPKVPRYQFRRLLQRDGRCDKCKRWNDTCDPQYSDCSKFDPRIYPDADDAEWARLHRKLHCYACDSLHSVYEFSSDYQQSSSHHSERRCLGQQGSVELCKHIQINWASIKAHIDDWRRRQQYRGGDWRACLDSFNIECHDASHDTRCTASDEPTWPRARLSTISIDSTSPGAVVLSLEWAPHSRIDTMNLTSDGRIPAPELRLLFQRLRGLGPADILYPASHLGDPPEMAFFGPLSHRRHFVHYQTGDDDQTRSQPPPPLYLPFQKQMGLDLLVVLQRGLHGKKLDMELHSLRNDGDTSIASHCLALHYKTDIIICKVRDLADPTVKIIPTDCWLHAMDTQTYPHPQASHVRPPCRDIACVNYFKRRKARHYCKGRCFL
ncbi:hypothetical protein COCC4DRAFT_126011 [Bipolaris maydis ATCC 48331]|uniref:F-box domain-containing protein n=2 Tax=Cochliobolus heterostrophus TaxID=5016 RepID=M2UQC0_COCH5|nr:uncharacterized protein COCC4DRAFT_126011 [Bipolaris maydis ATCC 48331]EMD90138.1 hypothetical protein COCHEDRAFT_1106062 [Bipolaris maydis C5]KAH7563042.1 hypothetical protein BM1_00089 [Bipolaris maydis]ENI09647.1 hypothetical protein COCC4DRAFT_126011 [Bipolaris maydis ATCC 48331]KAJ5063784.1 hypothetical protein J3E74DRAFT_443472 [Bipolaris maydis]KAJ6197065.1 hypothetical protein J3E72DRAFT_420631 [Bipolaris maydis]